MQRVAMKKSYEQSRSNDNYDQSPTRCIKKIGPYCILLALTDHD